MNYTFASLIFKFATGTRINFYEGLQNLIENGISVNDSLKELYGVWSYQGKKSNEPLALVTKDLMIQLTNGVPLSQALSRWVPYEEASLLAAGEQSARLPDAIDDIIRVIKAKQQIVGAVVAATAYPLFLCIPMCFLLWMVATELVPGMSRFSDPEKWTGSAWMLYQLSAFVTGYGILFAVLLIASLVAIVVSLPRWTGRIRALVDRGPFYSTYRMVHGSTFLLNLAVMMKASIPPYTALEMLAEYANPWLRERIRGALYGIRMGSNLGAAFEDAGYNFPDKKAIQFVRILAAREGFEKAINNYAQRWLADSVKRLQLSAKVSFSVAMITIGLLMGLVVMGTQEMQGNFEASIQHSKRK